MKIIVKSRNEAKLFRCPLPWAAISIATYKEDLPVLNQDKRIDLLQLEFRDTDFKNQERAFNQDLALQIIKFVENIIDKAEILLIHCEMGQSRSPGVAAALAKLYAGTDQYYFGRYTPNMLVYRNLIEAAVKYDKKFIKVFDKISENN